METFKYLYWGSNYRSIEIQTNKRSWVNMWINHKGNAIYLYDTIIMNRPIAVWLVFPSYCNNPSLNNSSYIKCRLRTVYIECIKMW